MSEKDKLLFALRNFEPTIELDALMVGPDVLEQVLREDPRCVYYISELSHYIRYFGRPRLVMNIKYTNTDVSRSDIHIISSGVEFQNLLSQYVGAYKKRLVFMIDGRVNVQEQYDKFSIVNAAFFPNFMGYSMTHMQSSMIYMPIYDFSLKYRIGRVKLEMMENEVDDAVEKIARMLFIPSMNAETKAFLAHNYLAYTIKYTQNENASNLERSYLQSAYGALINRKCVCQGYAEAFKRLMDYAGVPCDIVCGQIMESGEHHAWNIIRLNNGMENFHIDVTWDSQDFGVCYDYFGLRDTDLMDERTWNRRYNVRCNATRNLLIEGRRGIAKFRPQLLAKGVSLKILGI